MQYYLKTENGSYPPSYKHSSLESAKIEAERLLKSTNSKKVEILAIVGTVEIKDVPVTEKKVVFDLVPEKDLPF